MKTEYDYLSFDLTEKQPKKTTSWYCREKSNKNILGYVGWYAPWRQYCFCPVGQTVFNESCLQDIRHFIGQLEEERKKK